MNVYGGEFSSNVGTEIVRQVILSRHKQIAADWTASTLLKEKLKLTTLSNTLTDEEATRYLSASDFAYVINNALCHSYPPSRSLSSQIKSQLAVYLIFVRLVPNVYRYSRCCLRNTAVFSTPGTVIDSRRSLISLLGLLLNEM